MEEFNFDKIINRRNTGSLKWEVSERELPMWVADMDFETVPQVIEAIHKRADHGIYGYTVLGDDWYGAYQSWWSRRYQFEIKKEWLLFASGVNPATASIIRKMTSVGDNVLVMSPVYNHFFNSILNNGRKVLENRLQYNNGQYAIDFADLEEKLSYPETTMMILCNPHNPVGKIWDRETLERIGNLCEKYHVLVLSDEIHCDMTEPGKYYIPFASVSEKCRENSITCVAPTKTFNLAGIQTSAVIIPNEDLRNRAGRGLDLDEISEPNAFAAIVPAAAYNFGEKWLDALREYIWANRRYAEKFIAEEIKGVHAVRAEATYLLWIDFTSVPGNLADLCNFIREQSGLYLSDGNAYRSGDGFMRLNLACPRTYLEDGLKRLKNSVSVINSMQ